MSSQAVFFGQEGLRQEYSIGFARPIIWSRKAPCAAKPKRARI